MANTLKIIKKGTNKFWHIHNGIDATKFAISTFSASIDGNKFKKEKDVIQKALEENIKKISK